MTTADSPLKAISPPERLQGHQAGMVSRFAAAAIDLVIVVLALGGIYAGIAGVAFLIHPRSFHWPAGLGWSIPLASAIIAGPYLAIAWSSSGRTLGDALFGLRVVNRRGARIGLTRALLRAYFYLVFPLGLFWIPFSQSRRSLQDIALRTGVIYDWPSRPTLGR